MQINVKTQNFTYIIFRSETASIEKLPTTTVVVSLCFYISNVIKNIKKNYIDYYDHNDRELQTIIKKIFFLRKLN